MHTLEKHTAIQALHVKDAFVAQQIRAVNLDDAAEEFFQAGRIEGFVRTEHESADFIVVMMMMMVLVVVTAVFVALVVMIVTVVMIVVVCGVGMLVGQEVRVDVQDGIEVEAADVDNGLQVGLAEIHGLDDGARVHAHQAIAQRAVFGVGDQVFLGDQDAVGKTHLLLRFGLGVERFHAVLGVDHRDHRVQAVILGDVVVHEEGLAHRAGVGHAGGLDDDALEVELAGLALDAQLVERAQQVAAHRAADAAVGQLDDFFVAVLHQEVVVDALGPEFVFDHGDAPSVIFGQDALEQSRLARAEKAGEDGDRNHGG